MGMNNVDKHDALKLRRTNGWFEDWNWFVTAHLWTSLAADSGASVAVGDTANGEVVLTTGGTDNNEAAVKTTNEIFKFAADKPLLGESDFKFTEANTDDANVAFGFADAFGADLLVNDGAGPKTSFSGALIYKVDGGVVWKFITSISTTQQISTIANVVPGGGTYRRFKIEIRFVDSTTAEAVPFIDDQQCLDAVTLKPIKHTFTFTGATEMQLGHYVKAGGANSEVLTVDYTAWEYLARTFA